MATLTKAAAVKLGARGLDVPRQGLRAESFAYLRAGKQVAASMPITIMIYPDGKRAISDGRHRILIAREQHKTHVHGRILGMGPRGGIQWSHTGNVPI